MPEVILPCPACGSTNVYVRGSSNAQVTCRSCGMEGPEFCGPNEVIAAWDALPRALTWTHEPPKVAGWYWMRQQGESFDLIQHYNQADIDGGFDNERQLKQWAGPIALPVE